MKPLATALLFAATAAAQNPPPAPVAIERDPLSGMGHGLVLDTSNEIVRRDPTAGPTDEPAPFGISNTPGRPLFLVAGAGTPHASRAVFPGATANDVVFDAMSTGNDILPAELDGRIGFDWNQPVPFGEASWVNVAISVSDDSLGTAGSIIEARRNLPRDIGADLFSYWFEGNVGVGQQFFDQRFLSDGHEDMGIPAGADIRAIDTFMSFLADSPADGHLTRIDLELYFSVPLSSIPYLTDTARGYTRFAPGVLVQDITPATIFKTTWDPGTNTWGDITIQFLPSQLTYPGESAPTDIDAIAFDARAANANNGGTTLLFSETRASIVAPDSRGQILIRVDKGNGQTAVTDPKTRSGIDLRNRIGIRAIDNVDAICTKDPENGLSSYIGTPLEVPGAPPFADVGLAMERVLHANGFWYFRVQVHNLDNLRQSANLPAGTVINLYRFGTGELLFTWPFPEDGDQVSALFPALSLPLGPTDVYFRAAVATPADNGSSTNAHFSWVLGVNY